MFYFYHVRNSIDMLICWQIQNIATIDAVTLFHKLGFEPVIFLLYVLLVGEVAPSPC